MLQSRFLSRRTLVVAGAVLLASAVGACGRKGPLEPPPEAWNPPEGRERAKPPAGPTKPNAPFILDGLIK